MPERRKSNKPKRKPFGNIASTRNIKPIGDNEEIRLNKFIASSGLCSRREADNLIKDGLVKVNGEIVTQMGLLVSVKDEVVFNGKNLRPKKHVYILMNKPKDYITTLKDPHAKKTVIDLIKNKVEERVFPVGRLDRNTTGVLLLTNDGDLTEKLTHPSYESKKIYSITLNEKLDVEHFEKIRAGIELEDGFIKPDAVDFPNPSDKREIGIEIHSGKNRIVRRIFEHFNYNVIRLDRVYFCGLTKKGLQRGHWRYLKPKEIALLNMGALK